MNMIEFKKRYFNLFGMLYILCGIFAIGLIYTFATVGYNVFKMIGG